MGLKISNLKKEFGDFTALDQLNLELGKGEILGLIGQNGAGKTTAFRMILGLLSETSGTISWNGEPLNRMDKDIIGYLPEERGLNQKITVQEQIIFFGELHGMKKIEVRAQLDIILEEFGLLDKKKEKVGNLSKGNQQKIQLIVSIIHKPALLILDEPFSGLDPVNAEILKKAILRLKDDGTSIIFSSHQMANVEDLCEKVCLLKAGRTLFSGSISDLKKTYGKKIIYVKTDKNGADIAQLEGVESVARHKEEYKIKIKEEQNAKPIFQEILGKQLFIEKFSLEYPTLEEIFKEKIGG